MASCVITLKACQAPDEFHDYGFNLVDQFSNGWIANYPFDAGAIIRPGTTGLEYVSDGGVSNGEIEPEWPIEAAGTVDDGTITWTAQEVTSAGLNERIDSVVWSAISPMVASNQSEIDEDAIQEARIWVTGGVAGSKYRVTGLLTTTSSPPTIYELRLEMSIK